MVPLDGLFVQPLSQPSTPIATDLGWAETLRAEYLALTRLQADALVTLDGELARAAEGIVAVAPVGALRTA